MSIAFSSIPQKRLLQGITSLSSSFYLNNILSFDGVDNVLPTDLGTQHYCAFRNDTGTVLELMEIDPATISAGPVTILRRGLSFYGDRTTQTAALKLDWPANSIVMLGTDVPQIFQYLKEYIDAAAIAGAVPASTVAAGIVVEASQAEVDAGTPTKVISAVTYDLFATPDKAGRSEQKSAHTYAASAVGTDAYAVTLSPVPAAYVAGMEVSFKADVANTGSATLNVNGLGAKTLVKNVSDILATGDILIGQLVTVRYDGTNFQLVSKDSRSFSFGDGSDGSVTIAAGTTTLTRDMFYSSLVVTGVLVTDGFRIYVSGAISGAGTINWGTPNNGTNASGNTPGNGGASSGTGSLKTVAGGNGASSGNTSNIGGAGNIGLAGGNGGAGNFQGTVAGGTVTPGFGNLTGFSPLPSLHGLNITTALAIEALKAASGAAGGTGSANPGAGGGGGAGGGTVLIVAANWNGTFTIQSNGGNGGNGTGGAGGAGGGAGGSTIVTYKTKTWTGAYACPGGTGGTGNVNGSTGGTGVNYEVNINSIA